MKVEHTLIYQVTVWLVSWLVLWFLWPCCKFLFLWWGNNSEKADVGHSQYSLENLLITEINVIQYISLTQFTYLLTSQRKGLKASFSCFLRSKVILMHQWFVWTFWEWSLQQFFFISCVCSPVTFIGIQQPSLLLDELHNLLSMLAQASGQVQIQQNSCSEFFSSCGFKRTSLMDGYKL